jgi:hypothetical protein
MTLAFFSKLFSPASPVANRRWAAIRKRLQAG